MTHFGKPFEVVQQLLIGTFGPGLWVGLQDPEREDVRRAA
jgi:hypothetical protein